MIIQRKQLKVATTSTIRVAELPKGMYILRHANQSYQFVKE